MCVCVCECVCMCGVNCMFAYYMCLQCAYACAFMFAGGTL